MRIEERQNDSRRVTRWGEVGRDWKEMKWINGGMEWNLVSPYESLIVEAAVIRTRPSLDSAQTTVGSCWFSSCDRSRVRTILTEIGFIVWNRSTQLRHKDRLYWFVDRSIVSRYLGEIVIIICPFECSRADGPTYLLFLFTIQIQETPRRMSERSKWFSICQSRNEKSK